MLLQLLLLKLLTRTYSTHNFLLLFRFDVGEIVKQHSCTVGHNETALELKNKLANMGGRLLVDCFKELTKTLKFAIPQLENETTYGKLCFYLHV